MLGHGPPFGSLETVLMLSDDGRRPTDTRPLFFAAVLTIGLRRPCRLPVVRPRKNAHFEHDRPSHFSIGSSRIMVSSGVDRMSGSDQDLPCTVNSPDGDHFVGVRIGAPLFFTKNTTNLAGAV